MSVSVHLNGIIYLSSKEAGRLSGYTSDYVSRLAREGKVAATRVGTQWFVEPKSLDGFLQNAEKAKEERKNILRDERLKERHNSEAEVHSELIQKKSLSGFISTSSPSQTLASVNAQFDNSHAHRTALLALTSGIAVACLFVILPASPRPVVSGASLGNISVSVVEGISEFAAASFKSFFAFFTAPTTPLATIEPAQVNAEPRTQNGIVVLPPSATSSAIAEVKDSFSDMVDVKLDSSGVSGTITPVFSDGKGDEYRFVMVPISQSP